jgi:hypothetical protein
MKPPSHFRALTLFQYVIPLILLLMSVSTKANNIHHQRASGEAYIIHTDGAMVLDKSTNLIWQRCSVGQTFDKLKGCVGEAKEFTFEEAQQLSKNGWRVPTIRELESLRVCSTGFAANKINIQDNGEEVADACNENLTITTINNAAFPNTTRAYYWSSSQSNNLDDTWSINFYNGKFFKHHSNFYVRLVRNHQTLSDTLSSEFVTTLEKDPIAIVKKAEEQTQIQTEKKRRETESIKNKERASGEIYLIHKNSTMVLDKTTNLIWQRCSVGQQWSTSKGCTGKSKLFTFEQAQQLSKNDWRVPTIRELQSLRVCSGGFNIEKVDLKDNQEGVGFLCNDNLTRTTINNAAFPNTMDTYYWSSSHSFTSIYHSDDTWNVSFYDGHVFGQYTPDNNFAVRLVRNNREAQRDLIDSEFITPLTKDPIGIIKNSEAQAQIRAEQKRREAESIENIQRLSGKIYLVHKNGSMILDTKTNLVWQRCSVGQTWNKLKGCIGESTIFTFDQVKKLGKKNGWRVPTIRELQSLRICSGGFNTKMSFFGELKTKINDGSDEVSQSCDANTIDSNHFNANNVNSVAFPNTLNSALYWSSSPDMSNSDYAWSVHFEYGAVDSRTRDNTGYIRLVRTSQSLGNARISEFSPL